MSPDHIDALIVTALQLERQAVRQHLDHISTVQKSPVVVDIGVFNGGGGEIRVGVIEVGPGNLDAATLTTTTMSTLQPKVVLMVGIAGGIKDLDLGDVVAANKIYWVEPGKSETDDVRSRPDFGPVSTELVQIARAVAADGAWQQRRHQAVTDAVRPRAIVAPIVVGERVVASTKSADAQRIRTSYSDAVAVAMEDVGVMKAAAVAGADGIAIRAVSDLLDGKASADAAGGQPTAAVNAAAFAFEVLARIELVSPAGGDASLFGIVTDLYPQGPNDRSIWDRSGGDPSRIEVGGTGRSLWWAALRELARGGGGEDISVRRLLQAMLEDYPDHPGLVELQRSGVD